MSALQTSITGNLMIFSLIFDVIMVRRSEGKAELSLGKIANSAVFANYISYLNRLLLKT